MSKYNYSEVEQQINNVLLYQQKELSDIKTISNEDIDKRIAESEELLKSLGYGKELESLKEKNETIISNPQRKVMVVPSWENLCLEAENCIGTGAELESIFTSEELASNSNVIKQLYEEYNSLHRLDKIDITLCVIAGLLGATVDILLIGIPKKTPEGLKGGTLANYVREWFDKKYPENEIKKLEGLKNSKVPYDAQDNRNTIDYVEGLSSYYHRLISLGHDPLLGLVIGVADILSGRMTTIDKKGRIVSQLMENYADRKEKDIFSAIEKQIRHFKSDITTSMGLPAPLMGLFNLLQFGSIGEEEQTIAEIVQGMYFEGYDFIHFCTLAIPVLLIEVIIRVGYGIKRLKEGHDLKESIPFSLNREKHPKLATMLFISHSVATAVNAGKVFFTKDPMAINYPQWLAFAKYAYKQLKWAVIEKPAARERYIQGILNEELDDVFDSVAKSFDEISSRYLFVFE
ncbi:MAG: hypothetical protein IJT63_03640 [Lachnospiraceae bacterium]|nr:hypothetical protein [Clostridia bacterium]MBQ7724683.1 hypothetical protein [Lachnospiraceae bacterium]